MWPFQRTAYTALNAHEAPTVTNKKRSWLLVLGATATLAVVGTAGYRIGRQTGQTINQSRVENMVQMSTVHGPFAVNNSFYGPPTDERRLAWQAMFGANYGFFSHPDISPDRVAFSGFHQLHCLQHVWMSWWDHVQSPGEPSGPMWKLNSDAVHVQHCIELIRHALTCQPDLTLERVEGPSGGVTGLKAIHECRSWDDLVQWVDRQG